MIYKLKPRSSLTNQNRTAELMEFDQMARLWRGGVMLCSDTYLTLTAADSVNTVTSCLVQVR